MAPIDSLPNESQKCLKANDAIPRGSEAAFMAWKKNSNTDCSITEVPHHKFNIFENSLQNHNLLPNNFSGKYPTIAIDLTSF